MGEMTSDLRKFVAPEVLFGRGAVDRIGGHAANLRISKALVVSGPVLTEIGLTRRVVDNLEQAGVKTALYTKVTPNPRDFEVMDGAAFFEREGCDGVVAVGGGSNMDLAKAVGVVCSNERHVLEFEGVDRIEKPGPPLLCIPTTAGTGAEVSQFSIILDTTRRIKIALVSKTLIPDAAFVDPELTHTMSPDLTANTGLDALTHAFEAYVSNARSPMTDLFAREATRLIGVYLKRAVDDPFDVVARERVMLASLYAGMAFSNAILGAVHAMAHSLGGRLDLPHGLCNAVLLDHVVDYNYDAEPERYGHLARALGAAVDLSLSPVKAKAALLTVLRDLKASVGIPATLQAIGMRCDSIDDLADTAVLDPCLLTNPKPAGVADLRRIFSEAAGCAVQNG